MQFQSGDQTSAIGQMQSSSQIQTSEQASTHKPGAQYYIEVGGFGKKAAQAAGAVLDKILDGKATWQTLTNSDIDKLKLTTSQGAKAVSVALGIPISKALTTADARSAVRSAVMTFGQTATTVDLDIESNRSPSENLNKTVDNPLQSGIIGMESSTTVDLQSDFGKLIDSQKSVWKQYGKAIRTTFNKGTANAKKVFLKFVLPDSVASTISGSSYFDKNTRKVYLNASKDFNEKIGVGALYFHEHGHYIDYFAAGARNSNYISMQNVKFGEKLRKDYATYIQRIIDTEGVSFLEAEDILRTELKEWKKHGISDIIDGLSNGRVFGCASHSYSNPYYWKDLGRIEREAFANMFQSCFDSISARYMAEYFPEAYQEFNKMIKGLI